MNGEQASVPPLFIVVLHKSAHAVILQQYLGKDKYTVTNIFVGIIEIADIIHTDIAFDIFKGINAFKNVLNVSCCIFMFFYDDSHN